MFRKAIPSGTPASARRWWSFVHAFGRYSARATKAAPFPGRVGQEHADLAVDRVPGRAGVLAGDAHALSSLLEEAGLVDDEDARLLVREVLDDVLPQVVSDLVGVPLGRVQEALHPLRVPLPDGLGELPAVLAFDPPEQTDEVAFGPIPGLRAGEAAAYSLVQFAQRLRPPGDRRRPVNPVLRDHGAPFLVPPEG